MPQRLIAFLDHFPFIALAMGRVERPLATKLVETAIMSAVAGLIGVYVGVEVIKNDMNYLKSSIAETKGEVKEVKETVEQLRRDLYVPRNGGGLGS